MAGPVDVQKAAARLWNFHCVYDPLAPADVIIGLGSYDLRVAAHCAVLFHQGLADQIIFTGASGNWTQALFQKSEAAAFRAHAIARGVPATAITLEPEATNIGENIKFTAKLVPATQQAIFVTKPQTQLRCKLTIQKQWPAVARCVTAPLTKLTDQPLPNHDMRALICEMVGDLDRMRAYAARGLQVPVDVPQPVQDAFDLLVAAGFVDHL